VNFLKKLIQKIFIIFFDKLVSIYFTSFSNFILSKFRSGKDSFIKSIFSLSLSFLLKGETRALVETKKKNHGRGGD
jgi:hypothetical protein